MSQKQKIDYVYINRDQEEPESPESIDNDEIDLGQLFHTIWAGRGLIAGIALALCLLVCIYFGMRFLGFTGHSLQDIQLRFTFNGAEKGLYPNKTRFQLSDVISNQTLNVVYEKFKLSDSGLSQTDFVENISIQPAAVNRKFIDAKYKDRLNSKGLTQTEIEKLETAYKLELDTASRRSAILSYTSYKQDVIPEQLIEKILFDIPSTWSRLAINEHGVLDLPVMSVSTISIAELKDEEYTIGSALILDSIVRLTESLEILEKNKRIALVRDPQTGLTIKDLKHQLQTFNNYRLEPLNTLISTKNAYRDLSSVRIFLESKSQSLQDELDKTVQKAAIYQAAYAEHTISSKNLDASLQSPAGTNTEIGDAFIGQVLKLGNEVSESKYRQKLTEEQINLKLRAEDIIAEITLLERQLASLSKTNNDPESVSVADLYNKTVDNFSGLTDSYNTLMELARAHALSNNGALVEILNSNAVVTAFDKIQLKRVIKIAIIALILGAMIGCFIVLMLKVNKQYKK